MKFGRSGAFDTIAVSMSTVGVAMMNILFLSKTFKKIKFALVSIYGAEILILHAHCI